MEKESVSQMLSLKKISYNFWRIYYVINLHMWYSLLQRKYAALLKK